MTLTLPWPPTANNLTAVVNGRRILSKNGRQYRANALAAIQEQRPPRYGAARLAVTLTLNPPTRARRDLANFEKAPIDALAFAGVFDDDSQIDRLTLVRGEVGKPGSVIVHLETITWPAASTTPGPPKRTTSSASTTPAAASQPPNPSSTAPTAPSPTERTSSAPPPSAATLGRASRTSSSNSTTPEEARKRSRQPA